MDITLKTMLFYLDMTMATDCTRDMHQDGLILPRKPVNPCLTSADHQNLHRELLFNQKMYLYILIPMVVYFCIGIFFLILAEKMFWGKNRNCKRLWKNTSEHKLKKRLNNKRALVVRHSNGWSKKELKKLKRYLPIISVNSVYYYMLLLFTKRNSVRRAY